MFHVNSIQYDTANAQLLYTIHISIPSSTCIYETRLKIIFQACFVINTGNFILGIRKALDHCMLCTKVIYIADNSRLSGGCMYDMLLLNISNQSSQFD